MKQEKVLNKFAVIQIGSRQYKVTEGQTLTVESQIDPKLSVLLLNNDDNLQVGTPVLQDVTVKFEVEGEFLGDKVRVARFRKKSRYRKVKGHRQPLTKIKITQIGGEKSKAAVKEKSEVKTSKKESSKE